MHTTMHNQAKSPQLPLFLPSGASVGCLDDASRGDVLASRLPEWQ